MRSKLLDLWIKIHASYWFIPSLMATSATLAAILLVDLDARLGPDWLLDYGWTYTSKPDGARAILSTVAGSMITVAGVTFSMTLLAVSHASAQIGPRLLEGFMRDRGNQFTLGTFISTFLYCLLVLRNVHSGTGSAQSEVFVPQIALAVAMGLAMLSVAVLIFFIHHVPQSISVSNVVTRVGREIISGIDQMYPAKIGEPANEEKLLPSDFDSRSSIIRADEGKGYLRVLDAATLLEIATEHDLIVGVLQQPGFYATKGEALFRVWPEQRCSDEIVCKLRDAFSWGAERTRDQDLSFSIEQLIEVLAKAMSPGINGQYTAMLCLDQFRDVFFELLQRQTPSPMRLDEAQDLRLVTTSIAPEKLFATVMDAIRQFLHDDFVTSRHLLQMLQRLREIPALFVSIELIDREASKVLKEVESSEMTAMQKSLLLAIGEAVE